MNRHIFWLVHIIVFFEMLHLWEEMAGRVYLVDPFAKVLADCFATTPEISFYIAELVLFVFLGIVLALLLVRKKVPNFLLFVLGLVSLIEFEHLYEAIKIGSYYPGLVTGTLLGLSGLLLVKELFWKKR